MNGEKKSFSVATTRITQANCTCMHLTSHSSLPESDSRVITVHGTLLHLSVTSGHCLRLSSDLNHGGVRCLITLSTPCISSLFAVTLPNDLHTTSLIPKEEQKSENETRGFCFRWDVC